MAAWIALLVIAFLAAAGFLTAWVLAWRNELRAGYTTGQVSRRPRAAPCGRLACPSCGHQPAGRAEARQHRAEMAIL